MCALVAPCVAGQVVRACPVIQVHGSVSEGPVAGDLGQGHPMVIIPNQAAATSGGMLSGHFVTESYYNHYSLMFRLSTRCVRRPERPLPR